MTEDGSKLMIFYLLWDMRKVSQDIVYSSHLCLQYTLNPQSVVSSFEQIFFVNAIVF